ncbi:MAG: hypothetical protein HY362_02310, partial [Candidatus Aenigmarchaeota archaeon]|nr:hypothetical protein [Candidatus Aenigmarchaeota archaeon]
AAGLAGVAAVGVGYAALRNSNNRKYGNSSAGPGERLKTFWNNVAKEEKYYNEVRVPEINKRQAEIESIIKGFQEQARKKKEKEELEKVAEQVAWVNKLAGSGKLSTMEAAKELRVLSGSAGIGYENSQKLRSMSNKFLEIAEENDNRQKPVKELQNIMELYKSGKLSAEDLAAKLYKLSKNPYLSSELKGEILGIREEILKALREQGRGKELSMEPDIESVNQPSILGGITGAVTGFGSWVGNGINWLANNVGEPINKGIDWAKGKLWGYAGKAIGAGAGFVNSSLNLVSTVPFVGSSISNSIRNTILTSLSAINSSLTSIQDSILSKSDWIEKTSDSLSVAGMGMIGAGTASMMTGFGTPFAFPTMIAGAGMLAAGSVMDVSVWGAKESAGKANGWDRLRGLFGALMFVPEIGAAGKVGSVGKLVKGGRMLDELSNLKYITKVIQDGKAFYRPHYLNFIDSVSETAGNAVRVTDNLIRKLFNDQLLKNPFLRKDIEILIEESGGKKVLAETFVKTGGWYLGNKIEKIIFYRKAMEKFIKEMKVDSIESIRTIIDHELGHAASVESSKFWEFFGFPVSVRDWILNNIVADHPGVLEEILMGIRAADNDMSRIDIVHKIEDSLGGKYMENFDFVKQAIRELEGKAASSGGQFKEDLLYSARKLEGLMEKYKLEGKILPILGALGLGSLFGGKKDGKSENNVGGFEDSSLKLRKDSPEAARRDDEYNWKNILAAIGGVLGAILLGATTITCNGASLLCPVLEPPITVTGTVFDSLHNPLYSTSVLLHGSGDINKTLTQQSGNFDVIGYHNGTITAKAELKYFPNGLNSAGPAIEMLKINSHNADWSETQTETVSNEQHVMNQTYTIDFTFSHDQGGNAYYGLQNSYDYWRNHETANRISAFVNDPRPATAYYCLDKDKTLPYKCTASNEIHFSTAYQTYVLGLHEYGHSISHNWGLPGGHEEQPNPIEESWADFVIALVQNNSYIGEPYNLDIKNARNASAWGREWALAGVMWDLEQEKQGVVYDTLKPKDDKEKTTTLEILYNKFNSKGGIPSNDICRIFKKHGFNATAWDQSCV